MDFSLDFPTAPTAPTAPTFASLAWSNPTATEAPVILQSTYKGPRLDPSLLADNFRGLPLETVCPVSGLMSKGLHDPRLDTLF
jgi:hypothetical protein